MVLKFRQLVLLILYLGISSFAFAQFNYGAAHSHFSPTQTIFHNPATSVNNGTWLDFHLIGAGFFLYNDYGYIPSGEFNVFRPAEFGQINYRNRERYGLFNKQEVHLITITSQYKHHGFGLFARGRNFQQVRRVPGDFMSLTLSDFEQNQNNFGGSGDYQRISVNSLTYLEIGANYANAYKRRDHNLWIIGGNLKALIGLNSGGANVNILFYTLSTNDDFRFLELDAMVASSSGIRSGIGMATDVGVQYKKMLDNVTHYAPFTKSSSCKQYDYKWKAGVAVTDLGLLIFNQEAQKIKVKDAQGLIENFNSDGNITNADDLYRILNENITNSESIELSESFISLPPTVLQLQADYNFENGWHLSAQQSLGFFRRNSFGIRHPDLISLVPRFEDKWFEAAFPVSFYNYQEFRLGLMLRFAYLTIGTDKLGTAFGLTDVTGADVYFALAYKLFKQPGCVQKVKKKHLNKRNKTECVKK